MESPFPEPVPPGTRLIETFGWWPGEGARNLSAHLARMEQSAAQLGFPFAPDLARAKVDAVAGQAALRCRLSLGQGGDLDLTSAPMPPAPAHPWRVAVHPRRLRAADPWLAHKTTNRALYDVARATLPEGLDEYLFLNDRDELCEGTITNLFVTLEDGRKVTPPVSSGLLPGVFRSLLLDRGLVIEAPVTPDMLRSASAISLGNSLRGEISAQLVM